MTVHVHTRGVGGEEQLAQDREGFEASVAVNALTLWQPWATLVAIGAKRLETRPRQTTHRGPLAIHAGKHFDIDQQALCFTEPFASTLLAAGIRTPADLPLGKVLAVVELTAVFPTTSLWITERLTEQEAAFGDFSPGRWAWVLNDVRLLPRPIRARGMQGLWEVYLPTSAVTSRKERP